MDLRERRRQIFFNNLLILGFDKAVVEKEYRVTIDKNVFCLPNQQMFEVITFFLFSKLNEMENQKYRLPWPLLHKDQRRLFQKSCVSYLSNLAQESNIKFPRIVPSVLSTFSGDRLYEIYLAFSSHVVERTIQRNDNVVLISRPTISDQNRQDVWEMLKIATIISVEKVKEIQEYSSKHFRLLLQCSRSMMTNIHNLKLEYASSCSLLKERTESFLSFFPLDENSAQTLAMQNAVKHMVQYEQKVRNLWKELERFVEKEKLLWSCISSVVEENQEKLLLDGAEMEVTIPTVIKQHCPDVEEIGALKSEDGKICLVKYLKLLKNFAEFFAKVLIQGDLLQMQALNSNKKTPNLKENLNSLKEMNDKLSSEVIVNIKESIAKLEKILFEKQHLEDLKCLEKDSWIFSSAELQGRIANSRSSGIGSTVSSEDEASLFHDYSTKDLEETSVLSLDTFKSTADLQNRLQCAGDFPTLSAKISLPFSQENNTLPTDSNLVVLEGAFNTDLMKNEIFHIENINQNQNNLEEVNLPPAISEEALLDFSLDSGNTFKFRESWLNEESILSMTLPEASFVD